MHEHQARLRSIEHLYRTGAVPLHLLAQACNRPLVDFLHTFPAHNSEEREVHKHFPLMIRHGGRPLPPGFPEDSPKLSLHADVTAVLLADHLGILGVIERIFAPLFISANLVPALLAMKDTVDDPQPRRLELANQIIQLAEEGKLCMKAALTAQCVLVPCHAECLGADLLRFRVRFTKCCGRC